MSTVIIYGANVWKFIVNDINALGIFEKKKGKKIYGDEMYGRLGIQ